ncbi:MAG: PAS domain-containing protein [Flavobacterium sp.]|nr:MAG: PAS domain-containing protein [Flavobacterium sp.]
MINFLGALDNDALLKILLLSNDATAIYGDGDLTIKLVNKGMLKIWGKGEEILGLTFEQALPEMKGQPFTALLKNAWQTGETYEAKDTPAAIVVDGKLQTFYFDFIYQPIKNAQGDVLCLLHTATEVSARINAWKAVAEREENELKLKEELTKANLEYEAINEEYQVINEELATLNEEYLATNEILEETNQLLTSYQKDLANTNEILSQSNSVLIADNLALSFSERNALATLADAPVAIGILAGKEMIVGSANDHLLVLWGKSKQIIGLPLAEALPELQGQPFLKILADVFTSAVSFEGNGMKVVLERNGKMEDCFFNFIFKPITAENGKLISIMIVATDVTEQIIAKNIIDDTNERLKMALIAGKLGSYDVDLKTGKIISSLQSRNNFGLNDTQEFNLEEFYNSIIPSQRELIRAKIDNAVAKNEIYDAEYQINSPNGGLRWIKANGKVRYDENGVATNLVGVTQDISDKKVHEQRRDDFLSIASHELKTPITALKGNIQLLNRIKDKLPPDAERLIASSKRVVDKVTTLVDDLLNISRYTEGKLQLDKTFFKPWQLLEICCAHIRADKTHMLILEGDSELEIFADEHRIDQVVTNFVNNAVKYAPKAMEIYLKVEKVGNNARISVKDNGPGMPAEQLPYLFDRYWRADRSSRDYSGLGLGLFICAEIIRNHHGEIGAISELGKGSEFWFTIPLEQND